MDKFTQDPHTSLYCFLSRPRLSLLHLAMVAPILVVLKYTVAPVSPLLHLNAALPKGRVPQPERSTAKEGPRVSPPTPEPVPGPAPTDLRTPQPISPMPFASTDPAAMINSPRCRGEVEAFRNVMAYLNSPAGLPTKASSSCSAAPWAPGGGGRHWIDPRTNEWGICNAASTVVVNQTTGKRITWEEALYAYDLIFEDLQMFTRTSWMGVPMQQDPADAFALAALMWAEQPDLVIEIGTNTGGGALFYASIMRMYNPKALLLTIDRKNPDLDWAGGPPRMPGPFPAGIAGHAQTEKAFLMHRHCPGCAGTAKCSPFWPGNDAAGASNVEFILGRSDHAHVLRRVEELAQTAKRVMVMQDGGHEWDVVFADLKLYDRFVKPGGYIVVQDTKLDRFRGPGGTGPLRAVRNFMTGPLGSKYRIDKRYEFLLYSQHHDGFLLKVED